MRRLIEWFCHPNVIGLVPLPFVKADRSPIAHEDFGTTDTRFNPRIVALRPAFVDIEETASVVRAGLNLRFGRQAAKQPPAY